MKITVIIDDRPMDVDDGRQTARYFLWHGAQMKPLETLLYICRGEANEAGFVPVELEEVIEVRAGQRFVTASFPA